MTAGQLKQSWISALRAALREHRLKAVSDRSYARSNGDGVTDRLLLPLQAMGRGETAVMMNEPAISIILDAVEDELAEMKGEARNPDKVTWSQRLSEIVEPKDARSLQWRIDSPDDIPESINEVRRILENTAEPWWQKYHDRAALLDAMTEQNNCRQFAAMETRAVLAYQEKRIPLAVEVLESYQGELDRRGGQDDDAFEPQRRWLALARRTMAD